MSSSHKHWLNVSIHFQCFSLVLFSCVLFGISEARVQAEEPARRKALNTSVHAIFVFGDSTSDPGNNNYVTTIFKGNFPPYGRDFPNRVPTGRFTNGRLANDFIESDLEGNSLFSNAASYVGIKETVPPYLDPTLSIEELMTGVSFASAASGFDPLTPQLSNVISLPKQLEYFKEYQKRVELVIGRKKTKNLVKNALYIVSAGTNDFVVNYFTVPIRRKRYSLPDYMEFLLQQVQQFMQDLLEQGARRIGVVGLPPMGCLPIVITVNSDNAILNRGCVDFFSLVAGQYNIMLQTKLNTMQYSASPDSGVRIVYTDVYKPLSDMIIQSLKYGFDEVSSGCCGTGLLETAFLCNPDSYVCSDASKYMFWDSIHPSEKAYKLLFEAAKSDIDFLIAD